MLKPKKKKGKKAPKKYNSVNPNLTFLDPQLLKLEEFTEKAPHQDHNQDQDPDHQGQERSHSVSVERALRPIQEEEGPSELILTNFYLQINFKPKHISFNLKSISFK